MWFPSLELSEIAYSYLSSPEKQNWYDPYRSIEKDVLNKAGVYGLTASQSPKKADGFIPAQTTVLRMKESTVQMVEIWTLRTEPSDTQE